MLLKLFVNFIIFSALLYGGAKGLKESTLKSELSGALDEAAVIATEQRLNIDDMPEFTTVWRRSELRALGVKDLFEALSLVPGIQTSVMQNGIKKVVMRGFNNPDNLTFDRFKLIIDDHIVQTAYFQNSGYYLNYPIEMIERVEVVLGPAAALQTSGALTGVIRVITVAKERTHSALFARTGSYKEIMGGFYVNHTLSSNAVLGLEYYNRRHDRALEATKNILEGTSPYDNKSSEWLRDYSLGAHYKTGNFSFSARTKRERHGNYFGWEEHLELNDEPAMQSRYLYLQSRYEKDIGQKERVTLQLDYNNFRFDSNAQNYADTPAGKVPYRFFLYLSEESWQISAEAASMRIADNYLKIGLYSSKTKQIREKLTIDYPDGTLFETRVAEPDLKRGLWSIYLKDILSINPDMDGYFCIRYDYLDDMKKGYLSANVSLLYRLDDAWKLKVGYGHAYRAPSWVELYTYPNPRMRVGDPDLEAEEADTVEGSIIYKPSIGSRLQINIYRSRIKNVLDIYDYPRSVPDAPGYANLPSRFSRGFEFDFRLKPKLGHSIGVAYTYNKTNYVTEYGVHQPMPGTARRNGHLYYIFDIDASSTISAYLKYRGEVTANVDTDREDIPSYKSIDITYSFVSSSGGKIFASVKNLTDEYIADQSFYGRSDGIVRPGRTWLLSFEYPL